jgi:hypothetical protein
MTKRLLLFSACLCWMNVVAQHVPSGTIPSYYNGGFAGESGATRISGFGYVDYSKRVDGYNYGSILSGDVFLKAIRSGVSITLGQRETSRQFESSTEFAGIGISPKFSFQGKYTLAPFVDIKYSATRVDNFYRFFLSHYDNGGSGEPCMCLNPTFEFEFAILRGGFLFNSSKGYLGVSFDLVRHLFENDFDDGYDVDLNLNEQVFSALLQAGYSFQSSPKSKFSFTPQLALRYNTNELDPGSDEPFQREGFFVSDISLMLRYKRLIAGLNTSASSLSLFDLFASPSLAVGFQNTNWKIQLNQNFGRFSYLGVNSARVNYIASLGVRYTFDPKDPNGPPVELQ